MPKYTQFGLNAVGTRGTVGLEGLYSSIQEGMIDAYPIPPTGVITFGYYRIDDNNMAVIPHGYELDMSDPEQKSLLPITNATFFKDKPIPMFSNKNLPDGYYQVSPGFMSRLPPGKKPYIKTVTATGSETYKNGFINENEYYDLSFPLPDVKKGTSDAAFLPEGPVLPKGYYLNEDKRSMSILSYGKIANGPDEPGYIDNPNLISANGRFKREVVSTSPGAASGDKTREINNYDVGFHENADDVRKRQKMFDQPVGGLVMLDSDGNKIILPRESVQGDLTYNEPAKYAYGMRTFVPNYEDSVFLSQSTKLSTVSEYRDEATAAKGFCETLKNDPEAIEYNCRKMDKDSCAATSCCVLFGGSKCVRGDESGPNNRTHYGDVFVRNKDFYYYRGKCYGNCNKDSGNTNKENKEDVKMQIMESDTNLFEGVPLKITPASTEDLPPPVNSPSPSSSS
jgi:hypothetical protein